MRLARFAALLVLALPLAGCFQSSTLIIVKPDGSGTIEQTMTMTPEALAEITQLAAGFGQMGGETKESKSPELFSEANARAAATKLGEGVIYVSSEKIKTAEAEGLKSIYAFTDITKVSVTEKPDAPVSSKAAVRPGGAKPEDIHFRFARQPGGSSVVTLVFPEPTPDQVMKAKTASAAQAADAKNLAAAQMMFKGLRVSIAMQVAGRIIKTNSPYVNGKTVTILEMDFGRLLSDEAMLLKLEGLNSVEEAKTVLKGVNGFKFNFDREVTVEFAAR